MALGDVAPDLRLVMPEVLVGAFRVEDEPVRDQVDRCEVGLQAALAELRK
jgi:hypothetical protein